jgi:hypothetical protein
MKEYQNTLRALGMEGIQESAEELVNLYSEQKGSSYLDDYMAGEVPEGISLLGSLNKALDVTAGIFTKEGMESALLGFLGGAGQTALTTEGIDRIPGLGGKIAKLDARGNVISKKENVVYDEDTVLSAGDVVSQDLALSGGNNVAKGTVVTQQMVNQYGNELVNKKGSEKLRQDTASGTIVNVQKDLQEVVYENEGRKMSNRQAKELRYNQQQEQLKHQKGVS